MAEGGGGPRFLLEPANPTGSDAISPDNTLMATLRPSFVSWAR